MKKSTSELTNIFSHHLLVPHQSVRIEAIRKSAIDLARTINDCAPEGQMLDVALLHVQQAMMLANSAIATEDVLNMGI
jgi:hypothetical protein